MAPQFPSARRRGAPLRGAPNCARPSPCSRARAHTPPSPHVPSHRCTRLTRALGPPTSPRTRGSRAWLLLVLHRQSPSRPPPPLRGAPPATEISGWGARAAQPRRAAPRSLSAAARGSAGARGRGPERGRRPWCERLHPSPGGACSAPWGPGGTAGERGGTWQR